MKQFLSALVLFIVSLAQGSAFPQSSDPLTDAATEDAALMAEVNRRNDALINDGYNLTQRWSLETGREKTTAHLEFLVPAVGGEHTFSFWAEMRHGEIGYRLLGPDGKALVSWSGRKGEANVSFPAPDGKYVAEIELTPGTSGRAIFGVKGFALQRCEPEGKPYEERPASSAKGFQWPYLLFLPEKVRSRRLLVVPNNTGFSTQDLEYLRTSGSCEIQRQIGLAERLGTPLLVPLFPRPAATGETDNLYIHALTRASLETKQDPFRRVDLQLLAMIDDARAALREKQVEVEAKVFLSGFSAAGSFVSRFTMLHPERVAAVACGSPGGWPIAPVADVQGEKLGYPVGLADVKELVGKPLDVPKLRHVPWFFYMGDQDANDAVPFRDSFSKADEEVIFRRFGKTPVSRWKDAEHLYARVGLEARFTLYPGAAHSVTPEMEQDIARFFADLERKP